MRQKLFGRDPVGLVVVGLLFYVGAIYGQLSGAMRPQPGYVILSFVLECLPAPLIFLAACVLRVPLVLSALIAVAGPVILAIACFIL